MNDGKRILRIGRNFDNGQQNHMQRQSSMPERYLSDEELEKLIAMTQAEPLLHPPREFKSDIIRQIHRKRKYSKNFKLVSYSVKVLTATAAAVGLLLVMPESMRTEDTIRYRVEKTWQDDRDKARYEEEMGPLYEEGFLFRLNERADDYCSQFNGKLSQIMGMEDY